MLVRKKKTEYILNACRHRPHKRDLLIPSYYQWEKEKHNDAIENVWGFAHLGKLHIQILCLENIKRWSHLLEIFQGL